MDFGIAKVLAAAHATNTQSVGTLQYMSPEQIDAQTIDPRSDLYSLGLIFYEMLAGAPPFQSASPRELLNLQCTQDAPDLETRSDRACPAASRSSSSSSSRSRPTLDRPRRVRFVDRLAPFRPAVRPARTTGLGRRATKPTSAESGPVKTNGDDGDAATPPAREGGDTLHSTPPPKPKPATDTVALVEKSTAPRQLSGLMALVIIVALSLVAGLTVYLLRLRAGGPETPAPVRASASRSG